MRVQKSPTKCLRLSLAVVVVPPALFMRRSLPRAVHFVLREDFLVVRTIGIRNKAKGAGADGAELNA